MDIDNIGVGVIIKNIKTGKYLLIEERNTNRKSNKHTGELSIVVGHVHKGESLVDAALREINEELNIQFSLKIKEFLGVCHFLKGEIVILFLVETEEENLGRGLWFSIDELRIQDNLRPKNLDVIEKFDSGELKGLGSICTF